MSPNAQAWLSLEHRGTSHVSFAAPADSADSPVSVMLTHREWLRLGGPQEISIHVKPDPSKELLIGVEP